MRNLTYILQIDVTIYKYNPTHTQIIDYIYYIWRNAKGHYYPLYDSYPIIDSRVLTLCKRVFIVYNHSYA